MSFSVGCSGYLEYKEPVDESDLDEDASAKTEVWMTVDASNLSEGQHVLISSPSFKEDDSVYEVVFSAHTDVGVFAWQVQYGLGLSGASIESTFLTEPDGVECQDHISFEIVQHDDGDFE